MRRERMDEVSATATYRTPWIDTFVIFLFFALWLSLSSQIIGFGSFLWSLLVAAVLAIVIGRKMATDVTITVGLHHLSLGKLRLSWEEIASVQLFPSVEVTLRTRRPARIRGYALSRADAERLREAADQAMAHARSAPPVDEAARRELQAIVSPRPKEHA